MEFKRDIEKKLVEWKRNKHHKPLILRGASQVGKTSVVNAFGKNFDNYLYASLENAAFFNYLKTKVMSVLF